ncbi:hypothetical protein HYH03_008522 [Edaphochlamys debaryana]|uniref:DEK-C domain-containing protein n=1 Tax=Edaphochlamys debaryana TaxID=47281 RepID=A0A835Y157_9CHLO|nr:hypothetical protein HYH03_008522 [Edaphochlamys debaryana]|eukprot:KAG2493394.1 hypothetical protein HYH03_008522 [Edaphochlamys debaryana]
MADEERIQEVVREFLKTADMEVTTERIVLEHVAGALGLPLDLVKAHKPLVSSIIDDYLAELDAAEAADAPGTTAQPAGALGYGHGEDDEEEEEAPAAAGGRKRAGAGAGASKPGSAKRSRGSGAGGGEELLLSVELSGKRRARVRRWEGKLYVDIREFYEKDGAELPGAKGLSLHPGEWAHLAGQLTRLVAAQNAHDRGAEAVTLSEKRLASVSEFKGTYYLNIREYYDKDGTLAPTKKGVNLNPSEAEALLAAAGEVSALAGVPLSAPQPSDAAAAPPPSRPSAAAAVGPASAPPPRPVAAPPPRAAPAGGAGAGGGGGDEEVVELGGKKRASISRFGGRISVDLREFYEKNGQLLPGQKGIALSPADWATVAASVPAVSEALGRRDMGFSVQLSGSRRVSLSEFKGSLYVGVREYYEKDGQQLPGKKGLSMSPPQWAVLAAAAEGLSAALARAQGGA